MSEKSDTAVKPASLSEIQRSMRAVILGAEKPDGMLTALVAPNGLQPEQRLQIHRNNYRESLSNALLGVFPTITAFVGRPFVKGAALRFIDDNPPREARLGAYGGDFAAFLEAFQPARSVPYIADLARLEWAIHILQNIDETTTLDGAAAHTALAEGRLALAPHVCLVESRYPIISLWMAGTGQMRAEAVHLDMGGQTALAIKQQGAVRLFPLDDAEFTLLSALSTDGTDFAATLDIITGLADRGVFTCRNDRSPL